MEQSSTEKGVDSRLTAISSIIAIYLRMQLGSLVNLEKHRSVHVAGSWSFATRLSRTVVYLYSSFVSRETLAVQDGLPMFAIVKCWNRDIRDGLVV